MFLKRRNTQLYTTGHLNKNKTIVLIFFYMQIKASSHLLYMYPLISKGICVICTFECRFAFKESENWLVWKLLFLFFFTVLLTLNLFSPNLLWPHFKFLIGLFVSSCLKSLHPLFVSPSFQLKETPNQKTYLLFQLLCKINMVRKNVKLWVE